MAETLLDIFQIGKRVGEGREGDVIVVSRLTRWKNSKPGW